MIKLRTINNILSLAIIALVAWVLLSPFLADALLWWQQRTDPHHGYVYKSATTTSPSNQTLKDIPPDNRLVIPKIEFDGAIFDGTSPALLNKGAWHRPGTGSPTDGGNTVIAAHRLNYKGVASFYNLDKVQEGDLLIMYWQQKEYDYKVKNIVVVSPLDLEIEKNTPNAMLTLYTCTTIWSPTHRLVIQATLEGAPS